MPHPPPTSTVAMGKGGTPHYTNYNCDPAHCSDGLGKPCYGEDDNIRLAFTGILLAGDVWTSIEDDLRFCATDDCMGAIARNGVGGCTPGYGTGGDTCSLWWKISPPKGNLASYLLGELIYPDGTEDPDSHESIKIGLWRAACCGVQVDRSDPAYINHTGNLGARVTYHLPGGNFRLRLTNSHPTKAITIKGVGQITSAGAYGSQDFAPLIDQRVTYIN